MKSFLVPGVMGRRHGQGGQLSAIYLARYSRTRKNRLKVTREYESLFASPVEQRLEADVIAATEEAFQALVPNSEGKLAKEEIRAFFPPFRVSGQD